MEAFKNIKVLSFNHFLAGPVAAQLLGDMGANVIALEPLGGAFQRNWGVASLFVDGQSINHLSTGRNKRSLAVDMKSETGKQIVRRLIASTDVIMENFRPGTMAKLGFNSEILLEEYPRLIYASVTGFGPSGPYVSRPGQDLILQAMSGLSAHTGSADGPPVAVGSVVIDHHAAALYVMGILAALYNREITGKGGRVDVNLLQAAVDLQGESISAWLNGAERTSPRGPAGIASWFSPGGYGLHETVDGYVAISMSTPSQLCAALEISELKSISDEEGFTRREEITRHVSEAVRPLKTAEVISKLNSAQIWNAVVEDYDELLENPQLRHLGAFQTVESATGKPVTLVAHPIQYNGATPKIALEPQPLGAQTREILLEAGYSESDIKNFLEQGAIAVHEIGAPTK